MPTPTESPYRHAASFSQRSGPSVNIASQGGPLIVANEDARLVNTSGVGNELDPYVIVAGSGGGHAVVRQIDVPQIYTHMELYMAWEGSTPVEYRGIVVGLPPPPHRGHRRFPNDVDADFTARNNIWIPLVVVNNGALGTPGTPEINFTGSSFDLAVNIVDDTDAWRLMGPMVVYLAGVRQVMVMTSIADATADDAMILSRFVG